jgi:cation diffusion facilitator family transporter
MSLKNHQIGYVEGILSAVVNTALFGLKLWAGRESGSVSITADAWHTLSDTLTSLVVVFGFWIASKPRDSKHPFGHGRAEVIAAVVIGTLLAVVGFSFLKESFLQLRERTAAVFSVSAIIVVAVSVVVKEGVAQFSIRAGRRINSKSLVADGWHHRSDAISSGLILVGVLFGRRIWWIDGALGFGVSALILIAAVQIVRHSAGPLMGEAPDRQVVGQIRDIVARYAPAVTDIHHVHVHRYGGHTEVTLHATLSGDTTVASAHEIATLVEHHLRADLGMEATVHVEPGPNYPSTTSTRQSAPGV